MEDVKNLQQKLKDAKGPGNFRNMLMYLPNGDENSIKVIPLAEATAKDEFFNIKRASMRDILAGHRVPPQNLGVIPETAGGYGDADVADQLAYNNEIIPVQQQMKELNDWLGQEVITFRDYKEDEK